MPKDRGDEKERTQGREKIKPELLDEALKEYRGPQDLEEIQGVQESGTGACAGGGVKPALGVRQRRRQTGASNQPPKRGKREADPDRSREA